MRPGNLVSYPDSVGGGGLPCICLFTNKVIVTLLDPSKYVDKQMCYVLCSIHFLPRYRIWIIDIHPFKISHVTSIVKTISENNNELSSKDI